MSTTKSSKSSHDKHRPVRRNVPITIALIAMASAAAVVSVAACGTSSAPVATTTVVTVTSLAPSATAAPTITSAPRTPAPVASSACADLGGTVDPEQVCQIHTATPSYTIDITFPIDYPDQHALTDLVTRQRDRFIDTVSEQPARDVPRALDLTGTAYRSGSETAGTRSVVFQEYLNVGGAHPETYYEALNYDLGKHAAITLDTLFTSGTDAVQVLDPIVRQELATRLQGMSVEDNPLGAKTYQNFAVTDDAVIFFIGQGLWTIEAAGPQEVSVPRSELAAVLG